jgi:hypothetical protein
MAGLVPAISILMAKLCSENRDARHKAGHDVERLLFLPAGGYVSTTR